LVEGMLRTARRLLGVRRAQLQWHLVTPSPLVHLQDKGDTPSPRESEFELHQNIAREEDC
jgi:hypothetical protein